MTDTPERRTIPESEKSVAWTTRHLWQIKPLQDIFWIGFAFAIFWFGYYLRSVFLPILIGLGLAYAINPLLSWAERRWRWPRPVMIGLILGGIAFVCLLLVLMVTPRVIYEVQSLAENAPRYSEQIIERVGGQPHHDWVRSVREFTRRIPGAYPVRTDATNGDSSGNPDTDATDNPQPDAEAEQSASVPETSTNDRTVKPDFVVQLLRYLLTNAGTAMGVVTNIVSSTVYVAVAVSLIPVYFFFFAWNFNPMLDRAKQYIPEVYRPEVVRIASRMDNVIGDFLRGRIIVVVVMMAMFSAAFWLAGVPYALLLGCLTGLLNFVPYLAVIGWLLAMAMAWIDTSSGGAEFSWLTVVVWPTVAYSVVQLVEGWLLTPWIQGKTLQMSAMTILIVVFIGGALGGLYGLLLAIPAAGCVRVLWEEVIRPKLEHWAADTSA